MVLIYVLKLQREKNNNFAVSIKQVKGQLNRIPHT